MSVTRQYFSFPFFTQLVHRLHHTNARYNLIAHQFRDAYRPTYHAKRRASRAGLCIDTSSARALPSAFPILVSVSQETVTTTGIQEGDDDEDDGWDMRCRGELPEVVVHNASGVYLSPLGLEIGVSLTEDAYVRQQLGPVPSAPRMRPKALPGNDDRVHCASDLVTVLGQFDRYSPVKKRKVDVDAEQRAVQRPRLA